jgi:acyl-CoA reductase-like NAD-dependent aldehyde dehydrogenase
MSTVFPLMVPGAVRSGTTLKVVAPFDRQAIASVDTTDAAATETALETAHVLFRHRENWLPAERRVEILRRTAELTTTRRDELAAGAAQEGGKPLVDSRVEVDRAIDGIRCCIETLRTQHGREIPMRLNTASAGRLAMTTLEPIGPVLAFSAFNHPLNLIVHQVGPAIAAGCPVVIKPAESTPLSCLRFVQILREAGLPDEWCQAIVYRDHSLSERLAADRRVAFFSFIGSASVGWRLRSKLAAGARCALEHGGVAPVIVAADADLDYAVPLLTKGGFYHAGQVCVSVQRVFADRRIALELADRLAASVSKLRVGDPTLLETEVGPLIRPSEVTRVGQWVDEAVKKGAKKLCGGLALSETTYAPTVLLNPSDDARVSTHEVFGPVVCIYAYDKLEEAIRRANALPFAFQAAVFTRDVDTALSAAHRLDASAVMINDHTAFRVDWMPFAGLRESGLGTGGIPYTMHDMQTEKLIVFRSRGLM